MHELALHKDREAGGTDELPRVCIPLLLFPLRFEIGGSLRLLSFKCLSLLLSQLRDSQSAPYKVCEESFGPSRCAGDGVGLAY